MFCYGCCLHPVCSCLVVLSVRFGGNRTFRTGFGRGGGRYPFDCIWNWFKLEIGIGIGIGIGIRIGYISYNLFLFLFYYNLITLSLFHIQNTYEILKRRQKRNPKEREERRVAREQTPGPFFDPFSIRFLFHPRVFFFSSDSNQPPRSRSHSSKCTRPLFNVHSTSTRCFSFSFSVSELVE